MKNSVAFSILTMLTEKTMSLIHKKMILRISFLNILSVVMCTSAHAWRPQINDGRNSNFTHNHVIYLAYTSKIDFFDRYNDWLKGDWNLEYEKEMEDASYYHLKNRHDLTINLEQFVYSNPNDNVYNEPVEPIDRPTLSFDKNTQEYVLSEALPTLVLNQPNAQGNRFLQFQKCEVRSKTLPIVLECSPTQTGTDETGKPFRPVAKVKITVNRIEFGSFQKSDLPWPNDMDSDGNVLVNQ